MVNNNEQQQGEVSGPVKSGWESLPTPTKVILGAVLGVVVLGLLAFLLA